MTDESYFTRGTKPKQPKEIDCSHCGNPTAEFAGREKHPVFGEIAVFVCRACEKRTAVPVR